MARIRGKDTLPELALGDEIRRLGARYRRYAKTPVGRPDFVFPSARVAVFVDGCQWHGCPDHYVRPRTRNDFWGAKLLENVGRDVRQTRELAALGWTVLRVWEHEVGIDAVGVARRVVAAVAGSLGRRAADWRVYRVEVIDPVADLEHRFEVSLRAPKRTRDVVRVRSTRKVKVRRS